MTQTNYYVQYGSSADFRVTDDAYYVIKQIWRGDQILDTQIISKHCNRLHAQLEACKLRGQLSEYVKLIRDSGSWSQRSFAKLLSVTTATVNRWEAGTHKPQPRHLRSMENLLGEGL